MWCAPRLQRWIVLQRTATAEATFTSFHRRSHLHIRSTAEASAAATTTKKHQLTPSKLQNNLLIIRKEIRTKWLIAQKERREKNRNVSLLAGGDFVFGGRWAPEHEGATRQRRHPWSAKMETEAPVPNVEEERQRSWGGERVGQRTWRERKLNYRVVFENEGKKLVFIWPKLTNPKSDYAWLDPDFNSVIKRSDASDRLFQTFV